MLGSKGTRVTCNISNILSFKTRHVPICAVYALVNSSWVTAASCPASGGQQTLKSHTNSQERHQSAYRTALHVWISIGRLDVDYL